MDEAGSSFILRIFEETIMHYFANLWQWEF